MKPGDPLALILAGLPVPPASAAARERALHRATIALGHAVAGEQSQPEPRGCGKHFFLNWTLPVSAAILIAAAGAIFWRADRPARTAGFSAGSIAADRQILDQVEALFGLQLNAVVERNGAPPDIRVSQDAGTEEGSQAQPLLVEFRRGAETVRVLGYSGRAVCLDLGGRRTCFEPLATGDGSVILSADHFCWSSQNARAVLCGYRVEAALLTRS